MAKSKARELNANLHHLSRYVPPDSKKIRHDSVWARALKRWKPGTSVKVTFD